jgi:hypothetical protein
MPWPVHPNGLLGAQGDNDSYRVERSLRFNSADGAYLTYTPAVDGDSYTWTWSGWIKRTNIGSAINYILYGNGPAATAFVFTANDNLYLYNFAGIVYPVTLLTNQVFRDTSSWYHIVLVYDANNATASNRQRIYVNGQRITSFSTEAYTTDPAYGINRASYPMTLGVNGGYFDGYMAEVNFIDGQALTPSSFGETDAITGRWKAKPYSGTYGTNGSYLKFVDNSSLTTTSNVGIGKDFSGNTNYWATNGISITAGTGNDSLVDSPTNYVIGTATVGNFCTWNPLISGDSSANGNLDVTNDTARGNHELMKYDAYWEVTSTGGTCLAGIVSTTATSTITVGSAKTFGFKLSEAGVFEYANITDGSSFTSQATATTPPFPYASTGASITASINCGQRAFAGTLPAGYKPICTTSFDNPTIKKPSTAMDVVAYTGTGASNSISSLGFSPDLVWIKNRGGATSHAIYDTTRGTQSQLSSDTTGDQATSSSGLTAFGSNGFTIGTSTLVNTSGTQYVAWAWDQSTQYGFTISTYTGNGANRTIAHTLGVAPKMVIVKARTTAGADQGWPVWHTSIANTTYLQLNSTSGTATGADYWNSTSPTSSVFSVGTNAAVNANNDTYIAYCFAEIEGYSKFGSYTGNGSADGPFVWCGFRTRWVMIKRTDTTLRPWCIHDTGRDISNVSNSELEANSSTAENGGTYPGDLDILSNGFKLREGSTAWINESGGTYIFAAFAESPFKYARAR